MFLRYNRKEASQWGRKEDAPAAAKASTAPVNADGVEVIVLVEGVYNGPQHRALPLSKVDQIIRVAPGAYAQSLADSGFVRFLSESDAIQQQVSKLTAAELTEDILETAQDLSQLGEIADVKGLDWLALLGEIEGVPVAVKKRLWDAGFISKEVFRQRFLQHGFSALESVKGVNRKTAILLMRWAGELEEILLDSSLR